MNWDDYHMAIADTVRLRSKDESTQLGAVIVGPAREIRSTGYNSFPRGVNDDLPERQERPLKYKWFVHAEANAIFNAARCGTPLLGCSIYCAWPPCPQCAQAIIQVGISCVVVKSLNVPERWQGDMELAEQMLYEAKVVLRALDQKDFNNLVEDVKKNGILPTCEWEGCTNRVALDVDDTGVCAKHR